MTQQPGNFVEEIADPSKKGATSADGGTKGQSPEAVRTYAPAETDDLTKEYINESYARRQHYSSVILTSVSVVAVFISSIVFLIFVFAWFTYISPGKIEYDVCKSGATYKVRSKGSKDCETVPTSATPGVAASAASGAASAASESTVHIDVTVDGSGRERYTTLFGIVSILTAATAVLITALMKHVFSYRPSPDKSNDKDSGKEKSDSSTPSVALEFIKNCAETTLSAMGKEKK